MREWRVRDVMTTGVVTVRENTAYKEIVEVLAARGVSAVPVVDEGGRVVGIVSEADLLAKVELSGLAAHLALIERRRRRATRAKAAGSIARELMTSPVLTIGPDQPLTAAATIMDTEHVRRIPVIDEGRLVGIVARRDLLRGFLRSDEEIRAEIIEDVIHRAMWMEPGDVTVTVDQGCVTLTGRVDRRSTAQILVRFCVGIAGVVKVIDQVEFELEDSTVARLSRQPLIG